ncbi:hypothetical protein DL98DRAFT_541069 [Cadophora sp. DSE1049]|nr:hypothetical protein DL98DRAFT_541069 [Cadophora sp. DSE1049]
MTLDPVSILSPQIPTRPTRRYSAIAQSITNLGTDSGINKNIATKGAMAKNTKLVVKVAQRKRTKPYECEICQKSFGIYNYVDHLKTAHGTLKDWPCGKCKTRFTKITRLKIHLREHNGLERHCCGVCGHHSESKGNHEIHMRKHTGGKPHLCQTCEKPFASRSDQIRHEKRVCGKLRKEHPKGNELGLEESSVSDNSTRIQGTSNVKQQDGYSDDEAANPSPKDNRLCCVCGISDDLNPIPHPDHDELTIFCDSCNKSYHMACVGLEEIPDKWVCEPCDASLRDEFTSLLEKYHKRVCEPCDARLRDEITSLLEKSHKRVCEPCDANLRDEFTSLLGKSHKQVCEPCGANLRDEFISLLEIYHKQDWREVDKEVVNRVRDTRHLAAELWDFVRNLAKEDWREVDKEVINRVRETRHLAAKLWDFVRNLGKEERSKSHDPPSTLTAEESPPTTAMDDATPGSIPDIMPSESLSDVGEDSPPDWHVSADSLQEQGGDIVDPEPDGELDQEQYWEHNRSYNPPPNDPNTVSLWPTFDVGEGMPPNTGIVGIPSWDHTTQINPSLDLGLMSGTHGLVLEGQSNWNGFAFQGMDMNFSPRVPEGSAEGLRGDIWVGGYGQEQCQPYGGTPDRLRSTGGVALEHIGLDGIGGMPPIAVPNSFARPIEPMSNADLGSSSTPLEEAVEQAKKKGQACFAY